MTIIEWIVLAVCLCVITPLLWRMVKILDIHLEKQKDNREGYEECLKKWGSVIWEYREELMTTRLLANTDRTYIEDMVFIDKYLQAVHKARMALDEEHVERMQKIKEKK